MFKSFSKLSQANADFHSNHPVASTALAVTCTFVAIVVVNTAAKLAAHPSTVNYYLVQKD